MKPLQKIKCRLKLRQNYKSRELKPKALSIDGIEMEMLVMWKMDDDDPYPGEYALEPVDDDMRKQLYSIGASWIASGDVEEIK